MDGYTFTSVLVYCYAILLMLAIQATTQSDDTKRFCQNITDPINVTLLETDKITHPTNVNIKYYLYRINESSLSWCDSYNVCKQRGQRLAILNTKELQQEMTKLNLSDVGKIWIAGRRKDYGSDWTWVNYTLNDVSEDITIVENDIITKDCARITILRGGTREITGDKCTEKKPVMCFINEVILMTNKTVSWYNAMNQCVDDGGRLATWQELPVQGDANVYWFGLYKKLWLWIDSDQEVHPVLYSSWSSSTGGDCMTLVANGLWMATDCMKRLQYVMCEEHISPTTQPSILNTTGEVNNRATNSSSLSGWSAGGTLTITLSVIAAVIVIIVIVGVVIGVTRNKQDKKTNYNQEGVSNPVVNEYCEAHDCGPVMNPPDSMAYKPEGSVDDVTPYAEVKLPHTHEAKHNLSGQA